MVSQMVFAVITAFLGTAVLMPIAIPMLRAMKFGQSILEIGPSWHKNKSGTPTMGGVVFLIVITVVVMFLNIPAGYKIFLLIGSSGFGIIGFIDDFLKVVLKRNLGLRAYQKFFMQFAVALILLVFGTSSGILREEILIPFTRGIYLPLQKLYIPFMMFVTVGGVNSVNLTDGLDGLAGSIAVFVFIFFSIYSYLVENTAAAAFSMACIGGTFGFLLFNFHPAKIFMGDTGSLFLGGSVVILSLLTATPLILIPLGVIYVVETLSVIVQVACFKLTGRRVFKMSPLHHHFELCGWSEVKIVAVFCLVTVAGAVVAFAAVAGNLY